MNRKHEQTIYQLNVNVNLMGKNAVQIKGGITVNVNLSVEDKMYEKKIMFGITLHVIVKMENSNYYQWNYLWWNYRHRRNNF